MRCSVIEKSTPPLQAAYDLDRQEKLPKGQARVRARADILARREAEEVSVAASKANPAFASGSNTFPSSHLG